jgi:hypothetical protein
MKTSHADSVAPSDTSAAADEQTLPIETNCSDTPEAECDVVMKGGITSGVVYPKALYVHRVALLPEDMDPSTLHPETLPPQNSGV